MYYIDILTQLRINVNYGNSVITGIYSNYSIFKTMDSSNGTAQKLKSSIKDFFNKCDQIRSFLWI